MKAILQLAPAVFCWCLFCLTGCKQPVIEDSDLLTQDDNLNLAKDTLQVLATTVYETGLGGNGVVSGVMGNIDDPSVGNTVGGFYAQCRLTTNNVNFGTNAALDSVVLSLGYSSVYGDSSTTAPISVTVYELAEKMIDSVVYNTDKVFQYNSTAIGTLNSFTPNLTDSVRVLGRAYAPHFRMPLTYAFGDKILKADAASLVDNAAFQNFFKGFFIKAEASPRGNKLVNYNLLSSLSKITLFYHNDAGDSLTFDLPVSGVTVNHFQHTYSAQVKASVYPTNKFYIQGGGGLKGKLILSGLDSLPDKISINRAEIIVTQSTDPNDRKYPAPSLLNLYKIENDGSKKLIDDYLLSHYDGGKVDENVDGVTLTRYHFNIQSYFQKLINGTYNNNGLYLEMPGANSNAVRVVMNYKVTLQVTYTKL